MRTLTAALSVLALSLCVAGPAAAQDHGNVPAPDVSYTFGDHDVGGTLQRPDGESIVLRGRTRRETLVRPRVHFVPEMLKSIESI